jgi:hypothetical protein
MEISTEEKELSGLRSENVKLNQNLHTLASGNDSLLNQNRSLLKQNKELLRNVANYQTLLEKQNETVKNVRDFAYMAQLDPTGKSFVAGEGLTYKTEISRIMEPALTQQDGKAYFKCEEESLKRYERAIQEYPRFPFSYYGMAECLRKNGNNRWREYAEKAISILEKTTEIDGHKESHEQALNHLRADLEH